MYSLIKSLKNKVEKEKIPNTEVPALCPEIILCNVPFRVHICMIYIAGSKISLLLNTSVHIRSWKWEK